MAKRRFLITAALPYANGPLHFGHLAGVYIPSDIYSRHRRLQGHTVKFICGSDEHGVGVMVPAEKEKMSYQAFVDKWNAAHKELFRNLDIQFDFFGRTTAKYHAEETVEWFKALYERGLIGKQTEKQLYSIDDGKFLPDRFVEGTCYVCGYANARGDECPNCGEWIDPIKLKNPVSKMSGSRNIEVRETENYFLLMTKLEDEYRKHYGEHKHWRKLVRGFVDGLLDQGLVDRCITRDLDWGIRVPLAEAGDKRIYVWFDAPIGYVSNLKEHLREIGSKEDYRKDWFNSPDVELSHFIGKDNIIFHALIFPMMGLGTHADPAKRFMKFVDDVPANEFLNLEGKQFSKSSGWYIDAAEAIQAFGTDPLRYYLVSVIPETGDTNFSWDTFATTYDEFRNKIGNFVHRSLSFLNKSFPEGLPAPAFAAASVQAEIAKIEKHIRAITAHLDATAFVKAQTELLMLGQTANEFFQAAAPWKQIKENRGAAAATLAASVLYAASFAAMLEPVVPGIARKLREQLGLAEAALVPAYRGQAGALAKVFAAGFKLPKEPTVLLPQIMPEQIAEWKAKLGSFQKK